MDDRKPVLYALLGAGGTLLVIGLLVAGIAIGRSGNDDPVASETIPTPVPTSSSTTSSTTSTTMPTTTSTTSTSTTTTTSTTTSTSTSTTTSTTSTTTTTTLPPTTTTTVPPTTTTTTTTTTLPPEPFVIDLSEPFGGTASGSDEPAMPRRSVWASWWRSGNLRAVTGVGPTGSDELWAESSIWSDFVADGPEGTLRATVSYHGNLITLASFGSGTAVEIEFAVYELDGSSQGGQIYRRTVLDEEILAEAIQSASNVTLEDSELITETLQLEPNQAYRVRLDLRCEARAFFALSATQCAFGPPEIADTGPNYARWSNVTMTFPG
ncbi:MAG: hypothetical protein RIB65_06840 [Ilumatobacter fluminis]|uniref:hypothetical protein n=1 Tax=Ilumatobacter fluminis TaxID=467091 RepID=UPI0032EE9517